MTTWPALPPATPSTRRARRPRTPHCRRPNARAQAIVERLSQAWDASASSAAAVRLLCRLLLLREAGGEPSEAVLASLRSALCRLLLRHRAGEAELAEGVSPDEAWRSHCAAAPPPADEDESPPSAAWLHSAELLLQTLAPPVHPAPVPPPAPPPAPPLVPSDLLAWRWGGEAVLSALLPPPQRSLRQAPGSSLSLVAWMECDAEQQALLRAGRAFPRSLDSAPGAAGGDEALDNPPSADQQMLDAFVGVADLPTWRRHVAQIEEERLHRGGHRLAPPAPLPSLRVRVSPPSQHPRPVEAADSDSTATLGARAAQSDVPALLQAIASGSRSVQEPPVAPAGSASWRLQLSSLGDSPALTPTLRQRQSLKSLHSLQSLASAASIASLLSPQASGTAALHAFAASAAAGAPADDASQALSRLLLEQAAQHGGDTAAALAAPLLRPLLTSARAAARCSAFDLVASLAAAAPRQAGAPPPWVCGLLGLGLLQLAAAGEAAEAVWQSALLCLGAVLAPPGAEGWLAGAPLAQAAPLPALRGLLDAAAVWGWPQGVRSKLLCAAAVQLYDSCESADGGVALNTALLAELEGTHWLVRQLCASRGACLLGIVEVVHIVELDRPCHFYGGVRKTVIKRGLST